MSRVRYERVPRVRLRDEIAEKIRALIADGTLKVGDRLPAERELAQLFGVSRPAVREAVRTLEATGIVQVDHGIGVTVTEWAADEARGLTMQSLIKESHTVRTVLEARKLIEPPTARLAAERATDDDIAKLAQVQEELTKEIATGGPAADQDFQFHLLVAQASKNDVIAAMFSTVSVLYRHTQKLHRVKTWSLPERPQHVAQEHAIILAAIRQHDPDAAERAALDHLLSVEHTLFPLDEVTTE
jgi:GntR family transcriptional repressor for pyruvate dehydrogenase complex